MNLKFLKPILCLTLAASLYSCSKSLKVSASGADEAELKKYKTYAWIAPGDTSLNTRRDDKVYAGLIESLANQELQDRGMKIDNQNPDVVFMFHTQIEDRAESRQSPTNTAANFGIAGYSYGYNGTGYYTGAYNPMQGLETSVIIVEEGTISYSMFDRKTGKLLWKGSAVKTLNSKTDIEATIKKATKFIFAKLPVDHK